MTPAFAFRAAFSVATLGMVLVGGSAHAKPPPEGERSLFVSPCGRPYRAEAGQPYPVGVWFDAADTNKDGKLDRAEFRADADLFFKALDQDRNGMIESEEISFYEHRILPEMLMYQESARSPLPTSPPLLIRAQFDQGGGGGPTLDPGGDLPSSTFGAPAVASLQGAASFTFLREPEPVTASDGNFDHRITAAEFQAAADRRFKLLDKAGVGYLTLATLPKTAMQRVLESEHRGRKPKS
jgi:hypothetical protein